MAKRIPIKNYIEEVQLISRRSIVALVVMVFFVSLLIMRLAYLQLDKHDLYTTLSKKNWLDLVPVEPTRGLIYDRNGNLLAENTPVFSLDVIPYKVENFPQTLSEIAKIIPLSDIEVAQFQKQLKQHRLFDEIPLKMRLADDEVARFVENQYRFPGVVIKARLMRHYIYGGSMSHVLGYVGRINIQELNDIDTANYSASNYIGKLGIEKYYEDELHGKVGYEQVENDASGEPVRVLNQIKPVPGENLYLTIDINLQLAAEQALAGHRGAVVAIQPATGQILAMVSEPVYDPNLFVAGVSSKDFQALQQSPDQPLYNRALRGGYPPASTVKPIIALEALNAGITSPDFTIYDPGWFQLENTDRVFHDWRHRGHGTVNISKAITESCDTFFFTLSQKMGIRRIDDILSQFGYGELTGVDSGEELPGIVASPAWKKRVKGANWYDGDTVNSSIGQGFMQTTPLQLASAAATIANRGDHYTPYFLLGSLEPSKAYIQQSPNLANKIEVQDSIWRLVINAMQNVTSSPEGTAYHYFGKDVGYTVAGKSGTAQVRAKKHTANEGDHEDQSHMAERLRDHSLFISFAPVDKPQIALAVVVENANLAKDVTRKILDYYLLHKPIPAPASDEGVTTNDLQ
jgi:penicillin-binding protein 2